MSFSRWSHSVNEIEKISLALQASRTAGTHLAGPGPYLIAQQALWWLRDERNPIAAGATLLRVADDLGKESALADKARDIGMTLVQYARVRNPARDAAADQT